MEILAEAVSGIEQTLVDTGFPQNGEPGSGDLGFSEDPARFLCELWTLLGYPEWAALSRGAREFLANATSSP